jgi:O-antigen ligase
MIRQPGLLLTGLLTALLLWAPLPFGGVTPWAKASLQIACFVALTLAAPSVRPSVLRPVVIPAAALAAVALLAFAQSLAWPRGLVSVVSPRHAELYRQAAALPGVPPEPPHLSLAPSASRTAVLSWAAAAAALLAGAAAGRRRGPRRCLAGALVAGGLFQVFFGAQEQLRRSRSLWGVDIPASPRLHGTFVNPNHLALYLELGLAVAFAWGWWALRKARNEPQIERRLLLLAGPALAWLTLFVGLALSGSRAGLIGAVLGVCVQGVLAGGGRGRWRSAWIGLGTAAAGLAVVALAVGLREGGLARILATWSETGWGGRLVEYSAVLRLWRRFPLTGAGIGAFADAFPLVQPSTLAGTWWHAHSDLLELLATAGLTGALVATAGAVALVRRLLTVFTRRGRSEDRAAALALLGACASVAVHELFDFGLVMPANALTLATLAGAAAAVDVARPRASSAHPDAPRQDLSTGDALHPEDMEARPHRDVEHHRSRRPREEGSGRRGVPR